MKKIIFILLTIFLFACSKEASELEDVVKNEQPQAEHVILALWDSLTAWYWVWDEENYPYKLEKLLGEKWYSYKVINAWVSWDTSQNINSRTSFYLDEKPDFVILVAWWNDWLRWLPTQDLKSNLLEIIDFFQNNWIKVVLWWMDIPSNLWESYRESFKNVYKEIHDERKDVYYIDFFLDGVAWDKNLNISDMIHPNSSWYDIVVKNLYDFLDKNDLLVK